IGENAAEIIHIGQAVLALGGTIEYFRDTVFNYPTFAEAYKVAGLDGLNRLCPASAGIFREVGGGAHGGVTDFRRALEDRPLLEGRELPLGRPDLPSRERAPARAASGRARQAPAPRPLGDDARTELRLRAPEPPHPGARAEGPVRHGPRARRTGPRRQHLPRRFVLRALPGDRTGRGGDPATVQPVLLARR